MCSAEECVWDISSFKQEIDDTQHHGGTHNTAGVRETGYPLNTFLINGLETRLDRATYQNTVTDTFIITYEPWSV